MTEAAIETRALSKIFGSGEGAVRALDSVSVTIGHNEFFTLLGPSGCGKTTLLRLIAGFEAASEGEILLYGKNVADLPPFKRPVNTVFQNYALFPHMSVGQNVAFGLEMRGKPKAEIDRTVKEMLALVKMDHLIARKPAQLSGGQQQRVALARALANNPKVLLLDEPLSALDLKLRKEMQLELKRIQKETGITFIFVTHDQEEALTMSDRIAVMQSGNILQIGSPSDIYEHPNCRFVADFIGETNFLEAKVTAPGDGKAEVELNNGFRMTGLSPSVSAGQGVTVAIRPERAFVKQAGKGRIDGTIANIVYVGTDMAYYLTLDGSAGTLVAREQNTHGISADIRIGDRAGIDFDEAAVKILVD